MKIKDRLDKFYWNHWQFFSFFEDIPDKIFRSIFVNSILKAVVFTISYLIYVGLVSGGSIEGITQLAKVNVVLTFWILISKR